MLRYLEYGLAGLAIAAILVIIGWAACTTGTAGASVVVTTSPAHADTWIDGYFIGNTPLKREGLLPGMHVLRVTKFGCKPLVRELALVKGENPVKLDLTELVGGTLTVTSAPSEAEVVVDGEVRGATPLVIKGLGPGGHAVRLSLVNYLDWTDTIEIEEGKAVEVKPTLQTRTEENALAAIKLKPKDASLQCDLGHYYITRGEWQKAEDAFTQSLILTATEGANAYYQSRVFQELDKVFHEKDVMYENVPKGQEVIVNSLVRAIKACPTFPDFYSVALSYASERNLSDEAQEISEIGIVSFPYNQTWVAPAAQRRFGGEGNTDRLIEQLNSRIKQTPNDFATRFQRVALLKQKDGSDPRITDDYEVLVKLAKSDAVKIRLYEDLARAWERRKEDAKAAEAFRQAVKIAATNKEKAPIYYNLVRPLTSLKRNEEANAAWQQAVECQEDIEAACRWRLEWAQFNIGIEKPERAKEILDAVLKLTKDEYARGRAQELISQMNKPPDPK